MLPITEHSATHHIRALAEDIGMPVSELLRQPTRPKRPRAAPPAWLKTALAALRPRPKVSS